MNTPAPAAPPMPASGPLSRRIVSGCPKGPQERLYASHVGIVGLCLARFPFLTGEAREDACGAGMLGLWQAAAGYDPARGYTFGTYAGEMIRGYILHHLARQRRQRLIPTISLETPVGVDSGSDLADMLADPQAERPGAAALSQVGFDALIAALPVRQQDVLRGVYEAEKPLGVIGQELNISKQRCGQIHLAALAEIRKQQARRGSVAR